MAKSKAELHSKVMHEKISKQIKGLSMQIDKLSKKVDKMCPCGKGMGNGMKKKSKPKTAAKRK